jgi:hypothetical protein
MSALLDSALDANRLADIARNDKAMHYSGLSTSTAEVSPWGFPMSVDYEYDAGEPPILWPTDDAHPGCPSSAQVLACRVGGVDIVDMLDNRQIERIEEALLRQIEE